MTLVRYNSNREFHRTALPRTFSQLMDSIFDDALQVRRPFEGAFVPKMDIRETEKQYLIEISVPGLKKDAIKIDLEDRVLTISGERKALQETEGVRYHLVEGQYGSFSRTVTLPNHINRDSITATMEDGILSIGIEKDEKSVTKNIEIR